MYSPNPEIMSRVRVWLEKKPGLRSSRPHYWKIISFSQLNTCTHSFSHFSPPVEKIHFKMSIKICAFPSYISFSISNSIRFLPTLEKECDVNALTVFCKSFSSLKKLLEVTQNRREKALDGARECRLGASGVGSQVVIQGSPAEDFGEWGDEELVSKPSPAPNVNVD